MALAGHDVDRGPGNVPLQEGPVARRPGVVVRALPDVDRDVNLLEGEPPRVPEDAVVLYAALGALAHGLPDEGQRVVGRSPLRQHRAICRRERAQNGTEQPGVAGIDDADLHQRRGQRRGPPAQEQQHAVFHAEPAGRAVEVERDRTREERGCGHAIRHGGCTDSRVGATGRPAHHGEPSDPQCLGQLRHIRRPVPQAAPRLIGREAHARPVGGDEADARGDGRLVRGRRVEPGAETAVEAQDREAGRRGRSPRRPTPARRAGARFPSLSQRACNGGRRRVPVPSDASRCWHKSTL